MLGDSSDEDDFAEVNAKVAASAPDTGVTNADDGFFEGGFAADDTAAAAEADADSDANSDADVEERHFVAVSLPRLTIDDVWTRELEARVGCGSGSSVRFHNRRGTGGDMHFATVTYADDGVAAGVAKRSREEWFGGRTPVVACCKAPSEPTEVEVLNLDLPPVELLRQFETIGTVVAHRTAGRKLRAELVFAERADAVKALRYDKKDFKDKVVTVRIKPPREEEAGSAPAATAAAGDAADGAAAAAASQAAAAATAAVPIGKRRRVVEKMSHAVTKKLLSATMSVEVKEKLLQFRKTKEKVMENLKLIERQLKEVEKKKADGESVDEVQLGILRSERERLLTKRKKITATLRKKTQPLKQELQNAQLAPGITGNGDPDYIPLSSR
eukprot:Rhum_TRINITY_DN14542_c41_g1::Rhum_TRINITY_DN14542_c41_g1_i1::g.97667::m.97667